MNETAAAKSNQSGGSSRGLGGKPGESALANSCAGGGMINRGHRLGSGGSGFIRISWPLHLDRTQSTLERIDELSLRDLLTPEEMTALKNEIKAEVLSELKED